MKKIFDIQNYIGIFDGYIKPESCDQIIKIFDAHHEKGNVWNRQDSEQGVSKKMKQDDALVFSKHSNWEPVINDVVGGFREALNIYDKETSFTDFTGIKELHFMPIKCQRTVPGGGYHVWHVETYYTGYCNRALVYTIYLNDITEGGETEFLPQNLRCAAVKGRICIFPAGFPYIHRGNPPLKGNKYILTSWLTA